MHNNNDVTMWRVAQAWHQERLAEAEHRRMIQRFQQAHKTNLWRQLRWQAGCLMIALGRKLQTQVETHQMIHRGS